MGFHNNMGNPKTSQAIEAYMCHLGEAEVGRVWDFKEKEVSLHDNNNNKLFSKQISMPCRDKRTKGTLVFRPC